MEKTAPDVPAPDDPTPATNSVVASCLLFAAVVLAYIPAMMCGFIWDDDRFLYRNPLIHASDGLLRFWFSREAPDYFPLTSTTLWIEWRLWGMRATGYHVTNILLHGTTCVLLWRVFRRLAVPGAWLGALLFAMHPVNVESVTWITERKNTLSLFLLVCSVLAWLRWDESGFRRQYGLSLAEFAGALLSKTSVVMLPIGLLLLRWRRTGSIRRKDIVAIAPFLALSLLLGLVTVWFQYTVNIATDVVRTDSLPHRTLVATRAVWFYLVKAFVPAGLSFVYPWFEMPVRNPLSWLPLAGLAAAAGTLVTRRSESWRDVTAALGWFVVMLIPVLGFLDIYFMRYALVSDHWMQVSLPAGCALAAAGIVKSTRILHIPPLLTGVVIAMILGAFTLREQRQYRDEETLWRSTLNRNPDAWIAHNNLGLILETRGEKRQAEAHYKEALRAWPQYREAHYNLANVLRDRGASEESLKHYREATGIDPNHVLAWNNMGNLLTAMNRPEEGLNAFDKALAIESNYPDALKNRGTALLALGRAKEAENHFLRTLEIDAQHTGALNSLGMMAASSEDYKVAMEWFGRAVESDNNSVEARFNLASAFHLAGRIDDAIREYEAVLKMQPDLETARLYLEEARQTQ